MKIGATTDATEELEVIGDAKISGYIDIGNVLHDNNYAINTTSCKFNGDVYYTNSPTYLPALIMDQMGYPGITLRPTYNNYGYIGYSDYAFRKMYCYDYYVPSDLRQKENVVELVNCLDIILKTQAVSYDIRPEFVYAEGIVFPLEIRTKFEEERKNKIGFLAQDLEKVLPQLVDYNDSTDIYTINYISLIPVLSEAIKEQQQLIVEQKEMIEAIRTELILLKSEYAKKSTSQTQDVNLAEDITIPVLFQNSPNPFSEVTKIKYSIPESSFGSDIFIYNMSGNQILRIPLTENGNAEIIIEEGKLEPGMYLYSLISNGKLIDTKQMVLTK